MIFYWSLSGGAGYSPHPDFKVSQTSATSVKMHRVEKSQTNEKSLVERFNISQRLPGAFILSSYIQMRLLCQIRPLTSKSLKQVQPVWKCTVESTHRLMRLLCQMKPLTSKSLKQVHSGEESNCTHERIVPLSNSGEKSSYTQADETIVPDEASRL